VLIDTFISDVGLGRAKPSWPLLRRRSAVRTAEATEGSRARS
jgi:hypothetical protein